MVFKSGKGLWLRKPCKTQPCVPFSTSALGCQSELLGFSAKKETDGWGNVARVREVERRGEWKQNNPYDPLFLFNSGFAEHVPPVWLWAYWTAQAFSFFNVTASTPDGCDERVHSAYKSTPEWSCIHWGFGPKIITHKVKSSCAPIPRTWAFALKCQETTPFVLTLHVGDSLLFSERSRADLKGR